MIFVLCSHVHFVLLSLCVAFNAKEILSGKQFQLSNTTHPIHYTNDASVLPPNCEKQHLSLETGGIKCFKCSAANEAFVELVSKLIESLNCYNTQVIINCCSNLKASNVENTSLFPDEFLKTLQKYNHTPVLLKILSSFWTWSDFSILRMLLESNDEALELLNNYEAQIDPSQLLSSFPILPPAPCMTLCDGSTHTVLAVKCAKKFYHCSLKDVFDVRSLLVNQCDITPHCLQLHMLAAYRDSTVMCWLIPNYVETLISRNVSNNRIRFQNEGILEVALPGAVIMTESLRQTIPYLFNAKAIGSTVSVHQFIYTGVCVVLTV